MSESDRVLCATTARWLAASSGVVGALGIASTLIAALLLVARVPMPALGAAALLLALAERALALRTRFDAGLFADLARPPGALHLLDEALCGLHLRQASAVPRPLADRVQGARRLVQQHALIALVQFGAVALQLLTTWAAPLS
jgi:hypothetical protein